MQRSCMILSDGLPTCCLAVCVCTLLMFSLKDLRHTLSCRLRCTRTLHLYSRSVESFNVDWSISGQRVYKDVGLLQRTPAFIWGKHSRLALFTSRVWKKIPAFLGILLLQVLPWCWSICFLNAFFILIIRRCAEIINSGIWARDDKTAGILLLLGWTFLGGYKKNLLFTMTRQDKAL